MKIHQMGYLGNAYIGHTVKQLNFSLISKLPVPCEDTS